MRQLFNQLMGKKPTILTPSQMAMGEFSSGIQQWQDDEKKKKLPIPRADYLEGRELTNEEARALQARRAGRPAYDTTPAAPPRTPEPGIIAPPDTSGLINKIGLRGGGTASASPGFFSAGGMGAGALSGASGALSGIMSDANKEENLAIDDNFDSRNPIRDATLARARSGQAAPMRGLRYGGYVAPGEEVLVGEVAPEKVIAHEGGGVEVVPLDAPQAEADQSGMSRPPRLNIESIGQFDGIGYYRPDPVDGRAPYEGSDTGGISGNVPMDAPEAMADEGAPPPQQSPMDTRRIIARNNAGLSDEGVWRAREDVLREDQWKALNEPVKKSKWKDIGMLLLTSLNNQVNNRQDPVRTWGEIKRDEKVGALSPQLQILEQRRAEKYKETQRKNIEEDNKRLADIAENNRVAQSNALTQRKREAFYRTNKSFDPAKATEAQKRQLAEIGETPESIGQYDYSKRDFKQINGDTYKYDPNADAFIITNLPAEKGKALTAVTFDTPDKEVVTLWVPSTQAATIIASRERTGWQLRQRQELQEDAQNFRLGQKNQPTKNTANYSSPTAPSVPSVPTKQALETELKARKIQPNSPEWKKVMEAAGY